MSACIASRRSWRVQRRTSWLVARSMKWWSVVQSAPESRRLAGVQSHVSFKSPPTFEMPDFERVSFRTQTYALPRTSSTLLLSPKLVRVWLDYHAIKRRAIPHAESRLSDHRRCIFTCSSTGITVLACPSEPYICPSTSTCARTRARGRAASRADIYTGLPTHHGLDLVTYLSTRSLSTDGKQYPLSGLEGW